MLSLLVSQHKIFEQGHWKELAGKCRTDLEEIVSWVEKETVGLGDFRDIAGYEQFRGALWLPQETGDKDSWPTRSRFPFMSSAV